MTLMKPTRRDLLKLAAVAPAFALPAPLQAALSLPAGEQPAFHRFTVGEAKITVVSDGHFNMPATELGVNADPAQVAEFLAARLMPTDTAYRHTNHMFIELGDAKVLVDVGSGSRFVNTVGMLMENLDAAGIDPDEITHVFLTHAHPDHIWGIRDDFDEPIFPDATYFIGGKEIDYWLQDDLVNKVVPEEQQIVLGAVNSINAEGLEWTIVNDGDEIAPGISVLDTPGHTVGHISLRVESNGNSLIALGDSMTNAFMDFEHPEWVIQRDQDKDLTVRTRLKLLDLAASDGIAMLGYHFPFPGVGHVMREGAAYRFVPALWRWQG
jgi:glyoxylase-like metal-dependent hydrolase (beta-lactamase superfamily II)